jgi:hypothetical protein
MDDPCANPAATARQNQQKRDEIESQASEQQGAELRYETAWNKCLAPPDEIGSLLALGRELLANGHGWWLDVIDANLKCAHAAEGIAVPESPALAIACAIRVLRAAYSDDRHAVEGE